MSITVTKGNFARAETDRMFARLAADAGGVNTFHHNRVPTPIDQQPVIRMNRDTLYSTAVVDITGGATLTVPDGQGRYVSVMAVNNDHFVNRVFHEPGEYELRMDELETPYVGLGARVLVDPNDPADLDAVHAIQDGLRVRAASERPFAMPDYDQASFDAVRAEIVEMAGATVDALGAGRREEVDPARHLVVTAMGWGALPRTEAVYEGRLPNLPVGQYRVTVGDVPVDAFWSLTVYNRDGFLEANELGINSVNSVTATPNADGTVTVHFGGCGDARPNCIPIGDGWNYTIRLYRPRAEILEGRWRFPELEDAGRSHHGLPGASPAVDNGPA